MIDDRIKNNESIIDGFNDKLYEIGQSQKIQNVKRKNVISLKWFDHQYRYLKHCE